MQSQIGMFLIGVVFGTHDLRGLIFLLPALLPPVGLITQAICNSFKVEILKAKHNFLASGGHTFKIALYTSSWGGYKGTTCYSATNEVTASGSYSAGGGACTSVDPVLSGDTAVCDFDPAVSFTTATITARGALIYNDTDAGDAGVVVLDFGSDKTSTAGTFTITFPTPDSSNAIVRIA